MPEAPLIFTPEEIAEAKAMSTPNTSSLTFSPEEIAEAKTASSPGTVPPEEVDLLTRFAAKNVFDDNLNLQAEFLTKMGYPASVDPKGEKVIVRDPKTGRETILDSSKREVFNDFTDVIADLVEMSTVGAAATAGGMAGGIPGAAFVGGAVNGVYQDLKESIGERLLGRPITGAESSVAEKIASGGLAGVTQGVLTKGVKYLAGASGVNQRLVGPGATKAQGEIARDVGATEYGISAEEGAAKASELAAKARSQSIAGSSKLGSSQLIRELPEEVSRSRELVTREGVTKLKDTLVSHLEDLTAKSPGVLRKSIDPEQATSLVNILKGAKERELVLAGELLEKKVLNSAEAVSKAEYAKQLENISEILLNKLPKPGKDIPMSKWGWAGRLVGELRDQVGILVTSKDMAARAVSNAPAITAARLLSEKLSKVKKPEKKEEK